MEMSDVMLTLVKHLLEIKYEDLSPEAVEAAKKTILDDMGSIVAGSTADGCQAVLDLVREWAGREESSIWVFGDKVPAHHAALVLGTMGRSRDLADVHEATNTHLTEFILPAAFPVAEWQGGISGKEFITTMAVAQDITARIEAGVILLDQFNPYYNMSAIFGATGAVCRLLRFNFDTTVNAMGLAYTQAISTMQGVTDGALSGRLLGGLVAEAAIKAALLAGRGITGARNILQGQYGFYRLFADKYDLRPLTLDLGKRFEGVNISIKPYAGCKCAHGAINAVIDCAIENDIRPEQVSEIEIGVARAAYSFVCQPEDVKNNPRNLVDIQFSLPYLVATALLKRDLFLEDFTREAMERPPVKELMKRVKTRIEPAVESPDSISGALVTLRTHDQRVFTKKIIYVKGHPLNPMTMAEVAQKFRRCLPFAARPLGDANGEQLVRMVTNLESVKDMGRITTFLVSGQGR